LHHSGALVVSAELVNKLLDVSNFIFLFNLSSGLKLHVLVVNTFETIEITLVVGQFHVLEVNNLITDRVKEITRVRNNNDSRIESLDVVFEPDQSWQI